MMFKLPELSYSFDGLEPHIDAKTMEIHYTKHHQGYVNKLNKAIEGYSDLEEEDSIEEILAVSSSIPDDIKTAVINNGGGHYNHSLFWKSMSPDGGGEPKGDLAEALKEKFGSFNDFKEEFNNAASTVFGSGWAWLVFDGDELKVVKTKNQDNPISDNQKPLLGLDVWEHAYYLKYQNKRPDYIEAFWNVINWNEIEERYKENK
ncbi:MAG: superoxide dismutase [Candidatus Paceibacterota bacterium]